jgi:2-methylisocitrate lyase-like PEP mutase family enzyme
MSDQIQRAQSFHRLHKKGEPVVLYNAWDAGSAAAVAESGAKAIASGSHGVANANGYEDGEKIPLELALANARRIVATTELPVTMDIETGYGATPDEVYTTTQQVIDAGIVGVNIEDQDFVTSDLRPFDEQSERIKAIRRAADEASVPLFINARSDIFKNADPSTHDEALLEKALQRASAFKDAGADGFFVPGITDMHLIKKLCEQSPLPVNIIWLSGMPSGQRLADAGVSRISYGPGPYLEMIEWLKDKAAKAHALN